MKIPQQTSLLLNKPRDATPEEVLHWQETDLSWWADRQLNIVALILFISMFVLLLKFGFPLSLDCDITEDKVPIAAIIAYDTTLSIFITLLSPAFLFFVQYYLLLYDIHRHHKKLQDYHSSINPNDLYQSP